MPCSMARLASTSSISKVGQACRLTQSTMKTQPGEARFVAKLLCEASGKPCAALAWQRPYVHGVVPLIG